MPVEREWKVMIRPDPGLEDEVAKVASLWCDIWQGYRLGGVRLRKASGHGQSPVHLFTFKDTVKPAARPIDEDSGDMPDIDARVVIEVETPISPDDFEALRLTCSHTVNKTRYFVGRWEIDFLRDANGVVYCVLAEYELADGEPDSAVGELPPVLAGKELGRAAPGKSKWTNKAFSDPAAAAAVYRSLGWDGSPPLVCGERVKPVPEMPRKKKRRAS